MMISSRRSDEVDWKKTKQVSSSVGAIVVLLPYCGAHFSDAAWIPLRQKISELYKRKVQ
jgi:hypothetical protein